jgi:ATP-dependent Clp protease adaptor protein ClpS
MCRESSGSLPAFRSASADVLIDDAMFDDPTHESEGWTATLVPERKATRKGKKRKIPRYNVILWDSDAHSYEYVQRMLHELFGHTLEECFQLAKTVDTEGRVVVLTTTKEHAELKRDQILAYGKDDTIRGCKGSMHATIESAE